MPYITLYNAGLQLAPGIHRPGNSPRKPSALDTDWSLKLPPTGGGGGGDPAGPRTPTPHPLGASGQQLLITMAGMAEPVRCKGEGDGMVRGRARGGRGPVMDQRLALGACTPQIAPPAPPSQNSPPRTPPPGGGKSPPRPPPSPLPEPPLRSPPSPLGAYGQQFVGGGVVGVQNRGVAPPPPRAAPPPS